MTSVMRRKLKIANIVIVVLILASPIILISVSYYIDKSKYNIIKDYYYSDTEKFNEISSYFKSLYTDDLIYAKLEDGILDLIYKTEDEREYLSKDISSEKVNLALVELKEKYQKNSPYPIFSNIRTYYDDEGNMLLILKANTIPIKKEKTLNIYMI